MAETVPLTVGIPTYARGTLVFKPLERILACDPVPAEIIVHVDAGDGKLEGQISTAFPTVRVLSSPQRKGPGGGRHRCLQAASHEVFASFDDDSWPVDTDYFERLMKHVHDSPEVACFDALVTQRDRPMPPMQESYTIVSDYTGSGFALRTSVYRTLIGLVDRPTAYGLEERDLALQLHAAGQKILLCNDLRVFHDTDLSHQARPEIVAATIQNAALLTWLRYPFVLWAYGVLQFANMVWFMARRGRLAGIVAGLWGTPGSLWQYRCKRVSLPLSGVLSYLRARRKLVVAAI